MAWFTPSPALSEPIYPTTLRKLGGSEVKYGSSCCPSFGFFQVPVLAFDSFQIFGFRIRSIELVERRPLLLGLDLLALPPHLQQPRAKHTADHSLMFHRLGTPAQPLHD